MNEYLRISLTASKEPTLLKMLRTSELTPRSHFCMYGLYDQECKQWGDSDGGNWIRFSPSYRLQIQNIYL